MICRVCDSTRLEPVLDLGEQPWCNHFLRPEEIGTEPFYPLRLVYCHDCSTAQLDYTVKKEVMFGDHTYLSGVTRSLDEHFRGVAQEVDRRLGPGKPRKSGARHRLQRRDSAQALSGDGVRRSRRGIVEDHRTDGQRGRRAHAQSVSSIKRSPGRLGRKFDAINAAGVFFHLEELHSVTEGIRECLAADGIFVVQFLYMRKIIENLAFDQIYHEHLLYYNLKNIDTLLAAARPGHVRRLSGADSRRVDDRLRGARGQTRQPPSGCIELMRGRERLGLRTRSAHTANLHAGSKR